MSASSSIGFSLDTGIKRGHAKTHVNRNVWKFAEYHQRTKTIARTPRDQRFLRKAGLRRRVNVEING